MFATPANAQALGGTTSTGGPQEMFIQFIPLIVLSILWLVPCLQILKRSGKSRWWALTLLVPIFGLTGLLWIIAFGRWRRDAPADVFT